MSYRDHLAAHLRLVILRYLAEAPAYAMNSAVLRDLAEGAGITATRDFLEVQLGWLEEQGLATIERLPMGVTIATATVRGLDAAAGRAIITGVARPSPKG